MKKLLFLLLLILTLKGYSQILHLIPDPNFQAYLQSTMPAAMVGNSLNITHTLVMSCYQMDVSNQNITDLDGIQFFNSLSFLSCSNNHVSSLPTLPNGLTFLGCGDNVLPSLPTLPNSLEQLNCYGNLLTSLPALPSSLYHLNCRQNYISDLPELPNSIETLMCENNLITGLPALPNSLITLWCGNNFMTSLPSLPDSLKQLLCYNNLLNGLPDLPNSLQSLLCIKNNIACFPIFPASLGQVVIDDNPYDCVPNFVLPAMNNYTNTPLCSPEKTHGCMTVGIQDVGLMRKPQITIFPNPAQNTITVETNVTEKQSLKLFSLEGRLIEVRECTGKTTFDLSNLKEGVYTLSLKTPNYSVNKKLIIVR